MTSNRIQQRIERLLDEAEAAADRKDWAAAAELSREALAFDAGNTDAKALLEAAERMASPEARSSAPAVTAVPAPSAQPTSFANGRYEVRRFLGEGGKKRVYLAHDTLLDRDVAFALIKTEGLDVAARERITREAQAMGRLGAHPHIVTVFDIGEEPSPQPSPRGRGGQSTEPMPGGSAPGSTSQPYLVLPVLAGGDVEGLIEKAPEHRLPLEQAIKIAVDTCLGLEFAHSKGIVHRDLKPGNVWLTEAPSTGSRQPQRAMIGDFGLAVAMDRSRLTQAGMMVGTVSYMPPEQAMGGEITPRSDLYSLGAMLYEMVCGRPPFVGDESVAIIGQHLNTPPVAPSWHRPDCPPALEALILRLLEKDPSKRPASATEAREALENIVTPVGAQHAAPLRGPDVERAAIEPPHAADPLYRRTFVGREQELRQLHAAFDAALSGQGALAMVVGEPGIGKTSVCEQLATYASLRGGKTLIGHCYEEGSLSLPYLPFVEAMRSYVLARDVDGLRQDLGSGASEVARIVSEVRDKVQVSPSDGGDPDEQRWRLLQAVTGFLRNTSTVQPLLLILEDLHDADRGTLDLLLHVSRNLDGARLVIVGTYRDVEVDRSHPLSAAVAELRRSGSFLRVPLRGLTIDEVHRMYEAIRGGTVTWARAEAVHRQTEGNPLFVQEVIRYTVEEGYVVREGGRWVIPEGTGPETGIPEGLRDVVGRRLNRLGEKSNQVLSIAAVIGREFGLDVLQRVAGLPEEELFAALEEAQERAIIEQRQVVGAVGFRFAHAFFRQALYEEIFIPRRIRLHQQVGRSLEATYGRRLEEHAAELAEHFVQSTETADLEKALRYCELAAQRSMSVFAYSEAERHLQQALRALEILDPDDKAKRCDLLLTLADAQFPQGDPRRVVDTTASEAFALASEIADKARASKACRIAIEGLSRERNLVPGPGVEEWAKRADLSAAPGLTDRVYADIALGRVKIGSFEGKSVAEGRALLSSALDQARRLEDPDVQFMAAWQFIFTHLATTHWHDALDLTLEFSARSRTGVRARNQAMFSVFGGAARLMIGDRDAWEAWAGESLSALAAVTQDASLMLSAHGHVLLREMMDGRLEHALEAARDAWSVFEDQGLNSTAIALPATQAAAYLGREPEPARLVSYIMQNPSANSIATIAGGGEPSAATVTSALQSLADSNSVNTHFLGGTFASAIQLKDWEVLRSLLSACDLPASGFSVPLGVVSMGRLYGEALAALGEPEEARANFEQAIDACAKLPHRPELALTHLRLAELLLDHYPDERPAAIEHLDFAIGELREMKMQPSLERALRHRGLLKA